MDLETLGLIGGILGALSALGWIGQLILLPITRKDKFVDNLQEELERVIAERKAMAEERVAWYTERKTLTDRVNLHAKEIECLHEGQKQRDEMIAELKAGMMELEKENEDLRQRLAVAELQLERRKHR